MQPPAEERTILTTKVWIQPELKGKFIAWQKKFHSLISSFPGFTSLEISSEIGTHELWLIIQQFHDSESTTLWQNSQQRLDLINELKTFSNPNGVDSFSEEVGGTCNLQHGITEIFVTQVSPGKEEAFHDWLGRIHAVEATFPGFRRLHVQCPQKKGDRYWVTFLQFDTPKNLDNWLSSPQRIKILEESKPLIESLENHRIISPYAGWFASISGGVTAPPAWKQTMLVLLVLFPIVMLEMKYLSPLLNSFDSSFRTFIGNAISVSFIAWPMMPIAIRYLGWWLTSNKDKKFPVTLLGTFVVLFLYLCEIFLFWHFF